MMMMMHEVSSSNRIGDERLVIFLSFDTEDENLNIGGGVCFFFLFIFDF